MPKPVYEEGEVTVLWNQAVKTDREVTANRPDIRIKNKKEETCTLIDVAIAADRNGVQKEAEKEVKIQDFFIVLSCILITLKFLSPTNALLYYTYKMLKYTVKISHDCSYMFRSTWTIIREPMPNLAKVIILCM